MSQAPRQSRGLHPIRTAARHWGAERLCAHARPDEPVRGPLLSSPASAPLLRLASARLLVGEVFLVTLSGPGWCKIPVPVLQAVLRHPSGLRRHLVSSG